MELPEPDERAVPVLDALDQDHEQRREQEQHEERTHADQQSLREPVLPMRTRLRARNADRHSIDSGGAHASTRMQSAGSPT